MFKNIPEDQVPKIEKIEIITENFKKIYRRILGMNKNKN